MAVQWESVFSWIKTNAVKSILCAVAAPGSFQSQCVGSAVMHLTDALFFFKFRTVCHKYLKPSKSIHEFKEPDQTYTLFSHLTNVAVWNQG